MNSLFNSTPFKVAVLCPFLLVGAMILLGHFGTAFGQEPRFVSYLGDTDVSLCLASSPDNQNLYAGGFRTIITFKRLDSGLLEVVQVLNNHHENVQHVEHIIDMVVSPDGRHLYAVSSINQALLIFARNNDTGEIALVDVLHDRDFASKYGYFPAIEEDYKLLISPDGLHLYWLYRGTGVMAIFDRDQITGHLTKTQTLRQGSEELRPYEIPVAVALSPDGRHLYGASYDGKLLMFSCDSLSGRIALQNAYDTGLKLWPDGSIVVSPDGAYVFATSFNADRLYVSTRDSIDGELAFFQESIQSPAPLALLAAPDGKHIYVGRNGDLATLIQNTSTGKFEIKGAIGATFSFPAGLTFSPDGNTIYATSEYDYSLKIFGRDRETGKMTALKKLDYNLGGTDHLHDSQATAISPNGNFLFVAARGGDAGISVFTRDQSDGRLTLLKAYPLAEVTDMILSPEGNHLYVTGFDHNTIQVFAVDQQTGELQIVQTRHDSVMVDQYSDVIGNMAFAPDALSLYVNDALYLLVYRRDPLSGAINLIQRVKAEDYQLGERTALDVSPDGAYVYWSGYDLRQLDKFEVGIFLRNLQTGELSFTKKQTFNDWLPTTALKVSSEGRHVYASIREVHYHYDGLEIVNYISIFNRQANSGEFALLEKIPGRGAPTMYNFDLEITPDGQAVYATYGGNLTMYHRSRETGHLVAYFNSDTSGVYELAYVKDLAISPDGAFAYIAELNGVATFATGRRNSTGVEESNKEADLPKRFTLYPNYPNPFNPATLIKYDLPQPAQVKLTVCDMLGRHVRTLVDGVQKAGSHSQTWDGTDEHRALLPSGIYFYRLQSLDFTQAHKMMLIRLGRARIFN